MSKMYMDMEIQIQPPVRQADSPRFLLKERNNLMHDILQINKKAQIIRYLL